MLSRTGSDGPIVSSVARSNGAASMVPSFRTYRMCPELTYIAMRTPGNTRCAFPDLKSRAYRYRPRPQPPTYSQFAISIPRPFGNGDGFQTTDESEKSVSGFPLPGGKRNSARALCETAMMLPSGIHVKPRMTDTESPTTVDA